jgi:hypothetical protein
LPKNRRGGEHDRCPASASLQEQSVSGEFIMVRRSVSLTVALMLSAALIATPAVSQTAAPADPAPKMSKMKLTREKIKEMRAKWKANRPKLKACRKEVKKQGLAGDDRWFFIEGCMEKA